MKKDPCLSHSSVSPDWEKRLRVRRGCKNDERIVHVKDFARKVSLPSDLSVNETREWIRDIAQDGEVNVYLQYGIILEIKGNNVTICSV